MRERRLAPVVMGRYVLDDFEFDKLFEYTLEEGTNPEDEFGLREIIEEDILSNKSVQERSNFIQELVDGTEEKKGFREYLFKKRKEKGIPQIIYPISRIQLYGYWMPKITW